MFPRENIHWFVFEPVTGEFRQVYSAEGKKTLSSQDQVLLLGDTSIARSGSFHKASERSLSLSLSSYPPRGSAALPDFLAAKRQGNLLGFISATLREVCRCSLVQGRRTVRGDRTRSSTINKLSGRFINH